MIKMRELAQRGSFSSWAHVLTAHEAQNGACFLLRLWAGAAVRAAADMIRARRPRAAAGTAYGGGDAALGPQRPFSTSRIIASYSKQTNRPFTLE